MKLTLLAVVAAITMAKASILDNIDIDYTGNEIAASILDGIDIDYTSGRFVPTPEEIAAMETNVQTLTLEKRGGKQRYKPYICRQTNLRDCVIPLWEVDSCYNFGSLDMNDAVRSVAIPRGLTCAAYRDSNCRANRNIKDVTEWNAGAGNVPSWWYGASSIRCRLG